jgi:hypothetical protein
VIDALEINLLSEGAESLLESEHRSAAVLFAAEIRTRRVVRQPETLLAEVWNEFLGERAIPFDTAARAALFSHCCQHAELRRHIEAWQEMERTGSKWVTNYRNWTDYD